VTAYTSIVTALEARGSRHHGHDWQCPAHDDGVPSLSVNEKDGRVLLHCQAGCATTDIVAALGLTMGALFDEEKPSATKRIVAVYPYVDEAGNMLFEVVRYSPKDFRQRRTDVTGELVWNLRGCRRVLYRLPAVLRAARKGITVYVVEGERDVEAIEAAGAVATCNPGGAGKWRTEYADALRGASVVVVADRDEPGRVHARQVAASLEGVARDVRIVEPVAGKDAADHLAAGHGLDDFVPLSESPATVAGDSSINGTVKAADVHPIPVEWLWTDRIPLGMVTVFTGFPGAGKSTILYDLAARTSREGKAVLVATAEDHLAAVVRPRLEAAGANLELVHIVTDELTLPDDVGKLSGWVTNLGVAMFMLDPLVAFIGETVNTHRDHHVRRVLAPVGDVAEATGAAGVVVVHTNKGMGADPLLRVSGSIGFTGAARSVVIAAEDPQDDGRRIFAVVKSNLAEMPPALAYRLVGEELPEGIRTSRVDWLGEAPEIDVRELLSVRDLEERSSREEAIEYLRGTGIMEEAQPAPDLLKDAEALGINAKTLQRARRALGAVVSKVGFPGVTYWGPKPADRAHTQSGQHHPVHSVHSGPDLRKQEAETPRLDNDLGLGEQVEPGYLRIQREHGETPPTSDTEALANIAQVFRVVRVIGPREPW
jgi:hypothetical protein